MAMTAIWTGMTTLSLLCALVLGRGSALAPAALEGAASAVELCAALCALYTALPLIEALLAVVEKLL